MNKFNDIDYKIKHIPIKIFDYNLPQKAIAKYPAIPRGTSNLLVVNANKIRRLSINIFNKLENELKSLKNADGLSNQFLKNNQNVNQELSKILGALEFKKYFNLVDYLDAGDVVVINNVKVAKARLFGKPKNKHSLVEILLLMPKNLGDYNSTTWYALIGGAKKLKNSSGIINFANNEFAKVVSKLEDGRFILEFSKPALKLAQELGKVPIPKYLHREAEKIDEKYYQTVVAKQLGAIAAPTASLNLTQKIINNLKQKQVKVVYITLYVGWATFAPLRNVNYLDEFDMPAEYVEMPQNTADIILQAKEQGHKVLTFGTTATRTIEGIATKFKTLREYKGPVGLFISPGYKFKVVDKIITNFHPPLTTPLVLASATLGKDANAVSKLKTIYKIALAHGYKFYSYGDSMLIEMNK